MKLSQMIERRNEIREIKGGYKKLSITESLRLSEESLRLTREINAMTNLTKGGN